MRQWCISTVHNNSCQISYNIQWRNLLTLQTFFLLWRKPKSLIRSLKPRDWRISLSRDMKVRWLCLSCNMEQRQFLNKDSFLIYCKVLEQDNFIREICVVFLLKTHSIRTELFRGGCMPSLLPNFEWAFLSFPPNRQHKNHYTASLEREYSSQSHCTFSPFTKKTFWKSSFGFYIVLIQRNPLSYFDKTVVLFQPSTLEPCCWSLPKFQYQYLCTLGYQCCSGQVRKPMHGCWSRADLQKVVPDHY